MAETPGDLNGPPNSPSKTNVTNLDAERDKREREPWRTSLVRNGAGKADKLLANAIVPLREAPEWKGALRYNAFNHVTELAKAPPWEANKAKTWEVRGWTDRDDILLADWLQRKKISVGVGVAADAVYAVSQDFAYHPVKDYLLALRWDGKPRIDAWLTTYLGVEKTLYSEAVGLRWLVSAVARILKSGTDCKADCVLILEGKQGIMKSTALRILGGKWFLDDLRQFGGRECIMQLAGRWIIEVAELSAITDVTNEKCKAFLGQTMDSFRPPYGRRIIEVPRQCVFAATTNKDDFLRDETGDRRYWPVTCAWINIEALRADRDQLWAEAVARLQAGQVWWLETQELQQAAEDEQGARFTLDPWETPVKKFLAGKDEVTPEDILTDCFEYDFMDLTKAHRNRVCAVLRRLKWERVRYWTKEDRGRVTWVKPKAH